MKSQLAKRLSIVGAGIACAATLFAPSAAAAPAGCEDLLWITFGSTRRIICDGPQRPDGSWHRERALYTPAHYVPITCSGRYYVTCSGGYHVDLTVKERDGYDVTPENVLPNEPGHICCIDLKTYES